MWKTKFYQNNVSLEVCSWKPVQNLVILLLYLLQSLNIMLSYYSTHSELNPPRSLINIRTRFLHATVGTTRVAPLQYNFHQILHKPVNFVISEINVHMYMYLNQIKCNKTHCIKCKKKQDKMSTSEVMFCFIFGFISALWEHVGYTWCI